MAYNSSILQKLFNKFNETSIIYDLKKLYGKTTDNCIEPALSNVKSSSNSICVCLLENLRYVNYIIYSLYDSDYLQKFNKPLISNSNVYPSYVVLLLVYNRLIDDIINNNLTNNVIDKQLYLKYVDIWKKINNNIQKLFNIIKNNNANIITYKELKGFEELNLFNIYGHDLYKPNSVQEIRNFIDLHKQTKQTFLFFSVNKVTQNLDYFINMYDHNYVTIFDNTEAYKIYNKISKVIANSNLNSIVINGLYNTKIELLKFPEEFISSSGIYGDVIQDVTINKYIIYENLEKYLNSEKFDIYVFKLNNFKNFPTVGSIRSSTLKGFYNYKNNGIFNNINFNMSEPFTLSNSNLFIKCKVYVGYLIKDYVDKKIENVNIISLFYKELNNLLTNIAWVDRQHTFKYPGQLYLIMNVINNAFIKLSKPYLNDNDVISIIEHLKLFNTKFVNIK